MAIALEALDLGADLVKGSIHLRVVKFEGVAAVTELVGTHGLTKALDDEMDSGGIG